MKFLKFTSTILAALLLLPSCSQPEKKDSIDVTGAATDSIGVTGSSTDSADVTGTTTESKHPWDNIANLNTSISRKTDLPTEYNGEELSITMEIKNNANALGQGFFLYVNGERNDYSTDKDSEKKPYHTINLAEDDSIEVTLYFTPYNCKKGEKALVHLAAIFDPDYMLEDYFYVNFWPHHNTLGLYNFEISINQDTPESEYNKISTDCIKTEMTEEYEKKYIEDSDGETVNRLDKNNFFKLYQVDEDALESYYITENELTLNISACGEGGKFLVGIYVNHELQKAFGDNYYALCEIDREYLTKITATIDVSKLSDLNHIYMIYAPCDTSAIEKFDYPEKTQSRLLIIGDKDKIEAEREEYWQQEKEE